MARVGERRGGARVPARGVWAWGRGGGEESEALPEAGEERRGGQRRRRHEAFLRRRPHVAARAPSPASVAAPVVPFPAQRPRAARRAQPELCPAGRDPAAASRHEVFSRGPRPVRPVAKLRLDRSRRCPLQLFLSPSPPPARGRTRVDIFIRCTLSTRDPCRSLPSTSHSPRSARYRFTTTVRPFRPISTAGSSFGG